MNQFTPMQVQISSVDSANAQEMVVGRDILVDQLWDELRRSSLQVLSERRMGKTWVLHLAQAREPSDGVSLFSNVEDLKSADEFTQRLLDLVYSSIPASGKLDKVKGLLARGSSRVQGRNIGSTNVPEFTTWKERLRAALQTFQSRVGDGMPVLILDEMPHLLDSIIQAGRHDEAIALLDSFRALRQEMTRLRVIFCGSLGFHIVFHKLHEKGYTGQPVNDMGTFEVPPLELDGAVQLAGNLLLGEHVECSDMPAVAAAVADVSSRVPYYVQNVVQWMRRHTDRPWTPEAVAVVLQGLFDDVGDPANFKYYESRLDQYYPKDWVEKARVVLDLLSREQEGMELTQLLNLVRHSPAAYSMAQDDLLKLLEVLRQDHYVIRRDQTYAFKLEIVRLWWYATRGKCGT